MVPPGLQRPSVILQQTAACTKLPSEAAGVAREANSKGPSHFVYSTQQNREGVGNSSACWRKPEQAPEHRYLRWNTAGEDSGCLHRQGLRWCGKASLRGKRARTSTWLP